MRTWTLSRPGFASAMSLPTCAPGLPYFNRRSGATLAPAGAVKLATIPLCRATRRRTREGTRRALASGALGFATGAAATVTGAGAGVGAAAGGTGAGAGGGTAPMPDSATECVLAAVLLANVSAADRVPAALGVIVTSTVHVAPEASVAPAHVFAPIA